jgi:endonuclease/exonuclease/phosphatase (EEP) superfamily protein YafD
VDEPILQGYFPPPPPARGSLLWRAIAGLFRKVFWGLSYLAIALLLFGTVAGSLANHFWICDIACHFQVQYVVGLIGMAAVFAIWRRWKIAGVVSGAALCAFAFHWLPFYWSDVPSPAGKRTIRLLSANVQFDNRSRLPIYELIAREKPDVILLSEVSPIWVADLQSLRDEYPHIHIAPNGGHWGFAILSRLPIENVSIQPLEPITNLVLRADVMLGSSAVRIIGIHPRAPYTPEELAIRNDQFAKIGEYVGENATRTILAGDFNTSSWAPCFSRLLAATGMRDTRRGFGVCATFPTDYWPVRTPIDHCLVSTDIEVLDRRVGPDIDSDHLPILVDLRIEEDGDPRPY